VLSLLQQSLADVSGDLADIQSFAALKGKLPWPLAGRTVVRFGSRRRPSGLRWDGLVIAAPLGTEVRAVHRGRVAFSDWLRGFGLLLILDHGDGYMTLYGYNQSLFKEVGEWVETGEPVALAGRSGGRLSPGVYFGIRVHGKPVNPIKWCSNTRRMG
jgi:septal ring factor EnvC (AmiA/AmiB activator)